MREIAGNGQNKVQKGYFCQIIHFEKAKFCTFFIFQVHIWAVIIKTTCPHTNDVQKKRPKFPFSVFFHCFLNFPFFEILALSFLVKGVLLWFCSHLVILIDSVLHKTFDFYRTRVRSLGMLVSD